METFINIIKEYYFAIVPGILFFVFIAQFLLAWKQSVKDEQEEEQQNMKNPKEKFKAYVTITDDKGNILQESETMEDK